MANLPLLATMSSENDDEMEEILNGVADNSYGIVDLVESNQVEEALSAIDDMVEALGITRVYVEGKREKV